MVLMINVLLTLLLVVFEVDNSKQNIRIVSKVSTNERISDDKIMFSHEELVATVRGPYDSEIYIDAFEMKGNDVIVRAIPSNPQVVKSLQFLSVGHANIVAPPKAQIGTGSNKLQDVYPFVLTAKGFHFYVEMLPQSHREALAADANLKYNTSVEVDQSQILLLTPKSFTCDVGVTNESGLTLTVKGNVMEFGKDPYEVIFKMEPNGVSSSEFLSGNVKFDRMQITCKINITADLQPREFNLMLGIKELLEITPAPAVRITTANTGCQNAYETRMCQTSSDCCQWNTSEYKMATSCGIKYNLCSCIAPQQTCSQGLVCCDGTTCKYKCPPAPKFHYCQTNATDSCQECLRCTVDKVSLQVWPLKTPNGRCL